MRLTPPSAGVRAHTGTVRGSTRTTVSPATRSLAARSLAALSLAALLLATGCGAGGPTPIVGKETLLIGVRPDLPSLSFRKPDGGFEGYDVDVAAYVAKRLGAQAEFVAVPGADRERDLKDGTADMVLGAFSIDQNRKKTILFAGPYHLSYQDILVRKDETRINKVSDLKGLKICQVGTSNAPKRVIKERNVPAIPVKADTYAICVQKLKNNEIDAITTDDLILAGLAKPEGDRLRLLHVQLSEQRAAIGLRLGDLDGCEAINRAITQMYQDGTAAKLLRKWFGSSVLRIEAVSVPQFEGCS